MFSSRLFCCFSLFISDYVLCPAPASVSRFSLALPLFVPPRLPPHCDLRALRHCAPTLPKAAWGTMPIKATKSQQRCGAASSKSTLTQMRRSQFAEGHLAPKRHFVEPHFSISNRHRASSWSTSEPGPCWALPFSTCFPRVGPAPPFQLTINPLFPPALPLSLA